MRRGRAPPATARRSRTAIFALWGQKCKQIWLAAICVSKSRYSYLRKQIRLAAPPPVAAFPTSLTSMAVGTAATSGPVRYMKIDALAVELASPHGRGAQCAHWAERVVGKTLSVTANAVTALPKGEPRAYGSRGRLPRRRSTSHIVPFPQEENSTCVLASPLPTKALAFAGSPTDFLG